MPLGSLKKHEYRILITGGHLTPALAVLAELRKRGYTNFVWVGHKYNQTASKSISAEYQTITNEKVHFINLKAGKLTRKWTLETLPSGLMQFIFLVWGFIASLYIVLKYRPKLILSFGGYIAVPIVFWGKILNRKIVTHEQTIVTGLANKIIAKFANKILISWENSKQYFPAKKTVFTGNPIRRDIFVIRSDSLTKNFDSKLPILYVTGGNQGAHELNKRIFRILDRLLEDFNVIHQTGNSQATRDFLYAKSYKGNLDISKQNRYTVRDFIDSREIGEAFQKSILVLSRAGANTISEILALGKLCILMPIPWSSNNEQTRNAELVVSTGLGTIIEQNESLSPQQVYSVIINGLERIKAGHGWDRSGIERCRERAVKLISLDAPIRVVNELEKIILS